MMAPTSPAIAPLTKHHADRLPVELDAAVAGEAQVLAAHAHLVADDRPPIDEDSPNRDRCYEEAADVEGAAQGIEPRRGRDHRRLRQAGRGVAKGKAGEIGGDADGRIAEQQAGDQHRDAVPGFAPGGERRIEPGADRGGGERGRGDERAGTRQSERHERADKTADRPSARRRRG